MISKEEVLWRLTGNDCRLAKCFSLRGPLVAKGIVVLSKKKKKKEIFSKKLNAANFRPSVESGTASVSSRRKGMAISK